MDWNDPGATEALTEKGYSEAEQTYLKAYSDGFIDSLDVAGFLEVGDRQPDRLRDLAREAATNALGLLIARATLADPFEEGADPLFDVGGEG